MKVIVYGLLVLGFASQAWSKSNRIHVDLRAKELRVAHLINQYRLENHLKPLPYSLSLTYVAQQHAKDLELHAPAKDVCSLHSWSSFNNGQWQPCCYAPKTNDKVLKMQSAQCMWNKPKELSPYRGDGFEIAIGYYAGDHGTITPEGSLAGWKGSIKHNAVILNLKIEDPDSKGEFIDWTSTEWKAMGVGAEKEHVVVWFGREEDPACHGKGKAEPFCTFP